MSRKCSDHVLLLCAHRMSNTQFVFDDGTIFYASKVCKEYKYAWDDVKWLSLQNEISKVGKDTGMTVKLRLGRVRHWSGQISLTKGRTGNGSPIYRQPCILCTLSLYIFIRQTISSGIHAVIGPLAVPYPPHFLGIGRPWLPCPLATPQTPTVFSKQLVKPMHWVLIIQ